MSTSKKPPKKKLDTKSPKKLQRHPVVSAKLPTGQLVEMLFRPGVPETAFLLYQSDQWIELGKVPAPGGGWLVPYSPRNNLLTHRVLLLPTEVQEYDSEALLRALVQGFIHRYVDVSPDFEEVATQYVLLSWLYDDFNELPYLRVKGDYGSGKSRFLQTVGSLVYKPLFASGASSVSPLFRLLDAVGGTLVLDESDFRFSSETETIIKILNSGNSRGFPLLRSEVTPKGEYNPRAFNVYGPKVIATRSPFEDKALESRCITEMMGMRPVRAGIPTSLPESFEAEATSIRNRLLLFRLRHAGTVYDLDGLSPVGVEARVTQLFAPLLVLSFGQDRKRLVRAMQAHDRRVQGFRDSSLEAEVLQVAFELHRTSFAVPLKAIAGRLSGLLGEPVSSREVGTVLRQKLSVTPKKRQGVYVVPSSAFAGLRELAERYGVAVDQGDKGDVLGGEELAERPKLRA